MFDPGTADEIIASIVMASGVKSKYLSFGIILAQAFAQELGRLNLPRAAQKINAMWTIA